MFVLGGNVNGGKIYGTWPGLAPANKPAEGRLEVRFGVASCVALVATLWDLRSGALSSLL